MNTDPAQELADLLAPARTIDEYLRDRLPALASADRLRDAVEYALLGPGKRLRPILAWHACSAAGAPGEKSLPAGAALEMVHAFSLVHDDLPALDNDDLRRGRPTLHRRYDEATAILAGDALLAGAFATLAAASIGAPLAAALTRELAEAVLAMISGQSWDTVGGLPAGMSPDAALELIHRHKTGALIRTACRMGALCAVRRPDAEDPRVTALTAFGEHVGLMFQAVDDLLDAEQSTAHAGKQTAKDAAAGKLTYPAVLGVEGTRAEIRRLESAARNALAPLGAAGEPMRRLCAYMARRTR